MKEQTPQPPSDSPPRKKTLEKDGLMEFIKGVQDQGRKAQEEYQKAQRQKK